MTVFATMGAYAMVGFSLCLGYMAAAKLVQLVLRLYAKVKNKWWPPQPKEEDTGSPNWPNEVKVYSNGT